MATGEHNDPSTEEALERMLMAVVPLLRRRAAVGAPDPAFVARTRARLMSGVAPVAYPVVEPVVASSPVSRRRRLLGGMRGIVAGLAAAILRVCKKSGLPLGARTSRPSRPFAGGGQPSPQGRRVAACPVLIAPDTGADETSTLPEPTGRARRRGGRVAAGGERPIDPRGEYRCGVDRGARPAGPAGRRGRSTAHTGSRRRRDARRHAHARPEHGSRWAVLSRPSLPLYRNGAAARDTRGARLLRAGARRSGGDDDVTFQSSSPSIRFQA